MVCLQVRIMFEVQDLRFATLATVSRCGMVWFSEDILSTEMIFENFLMKLRHVSVDDADDDTSGHVRAIAPGGVAPAETQEDDVSPTLLVQRDCASILMPYFSPDGLVNKCFKHCTPLDHITDYTRLRALGTFFSMLNQSVRYVLAYNSSYPRLPHAGE